MARVRPSPSAPAEPTSTGAVKADLPAPRVRASGVAKKKKAASAAPVGPAGRTVGGQVVLLVGIAGSVLTTLALATYDSHDPSLSVAGSGTKIGRAHV